MFHSTWVQSLPCASKTSAAPSRVKDFPAQHCLIIKIGRCVDDVMMRMDVLMYDIYIYVYVYICVHIYIYIYIYVYVYIYIHTYIYTYIYIYIHIYMYIYMYICIYVYMYICIYVYMYVYIYTYVYTYIHIQLYIYIHIYIYTYIHIYIYTYIHIYIYIYIHIYIYTYIHIYIYIYIYIYIGCDRIWVSVDTGIPFFQTNSYNAMYSAYVIMCLCTWVNLCTIHTQDIFLSIHIIDYIYIYYISQYASCIFVFEFICSARTGKSYWNTTTAPPTTKGSGTGGALYGDGVRSLCLSWHGPKKKPSTGSFMCSIQLMTILDKTW